MELLRAVYRRLDRKSLLAEFPGLTPQKLDEYFRRVAALLEPVATTSAAAAGPLQAETRRPSARPHRRVVLHTDGGSRGNPGPAGCGIVLLDEAGATLREEAVYLGEATCNEAEYHALLHGLAAAQEIGARDIVIRADSELLVRQITGLYKVRKPNLVILFDKAKEALGRFTSWRAEHIPRTRDGRADLLANQAMDRGS